MPLPAMQMEVERIYHQVCKHQYRSLALVASQAKEGVSSLVSAIAERSLLAGKSTLVVDLNLYHPSFVPQNLLDTKQPHTTLDDVQYLYMEGNLSLFTGIANPKDRNVIMELRQPNKLEHYIQKWHQDFDFIIFDTSPLSRNNARNIPAERVAKACDGAILVVLAAKTTQPQVAEAIKQLKEADVTLLGCVLNDQFNPPLRTELLRELDRFPKVMPKTLAKLKRWINEYPLFGLEL